jgi:hypothetical protein
MGGAKMKMSSEAWKILSDWQRRGDFTRSLGCCVIWRHYSVSHLLGVGVLSMLKLLSIDGMKLGCSEFLAIVLKYLPGISITYLAF